MRIIDLLNLIAKGEEVPKEIRYKGNIYTYVYNDIREANIINYYCDLETHIHLIDGGYHDIRLNDEVEIIEEEKEIKKFHYNNAIWEEQARDLDYMFKDKIDELIDEINKLKRDKEDDK